MVTIGDPSSLSDEISALMNYLRCSKNELDKMIDDTYDSYPQIEKRRDSIYLLAEHKNLKFNYDPDGILTGITKNTSDLSLNFDKYIE